MSDRGNRLELIYLMNTILGLIRVKKSIAKSVFEGNEKKMLTSKWFEL